MKYKNSIEKKNANLKPGRGRPKGVKNKVPRTMKDTILHVWEVLQETPEMSLLDCAENNPIWFYELCKSMFPKDLFITTDVSIKTMSPDEIKAEIIELIKNNPGLAEALQMLPGVEKAG